MALSPTCTIGGSPTPANVTGGITINGALASPAGAVFWAVKAVGVDDITGAAGLAAINASIVVNQTNKTFSFTSPSGLGSAVIFMSTVGVSPNSSLGNGLDINGQTVAAYTTTFKVSVPTTNGYRVVAQNEVLEADPEYGWLVPINAAIRAAGTGGGGGGAGGQSNLTLANGRNDNISTAGQFAIFIGGPTGAFSVSGIATTAAILAGLPVTLNNTTASPMTLLHQDGNSLAANRIDCQTGNGAPITLKPYKGSAILVYNSVAQRWVVQSRGVEAQAPDYVDAREIGGIVYNDTTVDNALALNKAVAAGAVPGNSPHVWLGPVGGQTTSPFVITIKAPIFHPQGVRVSGPYGKKQHGNENAVSISNNIGGTTAAYHGPLWVFESNQKPPQITSYSGILGIDSIVPDGSVSEAFGCFANQYTDKATINGLTSISIFTRFRLMANCPENQDMFVMCYGGADTASNNTCTQTYVTTTSSNTNELVACLATSATGIHATTVSTGLSLNTNYECCITLDPTSFASPTIRFFLNGVENVGARVTLSAGETVKQEYYEWLWLFQAYSSFGFAEIATAIVGMTFFGMKIETQATTANYTPDFGTPFAYVNPSQTIFVVPGATSMASVVRSDLPYTGAWMVGYDKYSIPVWMLITGTGLTGADGDQFTLNSVLERVDLSVADSIGSSTSVGGGVHVHDSLQCEIRDLSIAAPLGVYLEHFCYLTKVHNVLFGGAGNGNQFGGLIYIGSGAGLGRYTDLSTQTVGMAVAWPWGIYAGGAGGFFSGFYSSGWSGYGFWYLTGGGLSSAQIEDWNYSDEGGLGVSQAYLYSYFMDMILIRGGVLAAIYNSYSSTSFYTLVGTQNIEIDGSHLLSTNIHRLFSFPTSPSGRVAVAIPALSSSTLWVDAANPGRVDNLILGKKTVVITAGSTSQAITDAQFQYGMMEVASGLTGTTTLTAPYDVPDKEGECHNLDGIHSVIIHPHGSGTAATFPAGQSGRWKYDSTGTNIFNLGAPA